MLGFLLRQKTAVAGGGGGLFTNDTQSRPILLHWSHELLACPLRLPRMVRHDTLLLISESPVVERVHPMNKKQQDQQGMIATRTAFRMGTRFSLCRFIYAKIIDELQTCSSRPYNSSGPELLREYLVYPSLSSTCV